MRYSLLESKLFSARPQTDPLLEHHRKNLIGTVAKKLDQARMIRFVDHTGTLHSTDLGRTASHFYIKHASIEVSMVCFIVSQFTHVTGVVEFSIICTFIQWRYI